MDDRVGDGLLQPRATSTSSTHTVNFQSNDKNTVTAPGEPGRAMTSSYTPYTTNDCSGPASGSTSDPDERPQRHERRARIPNLAQRCGINLMLVLDESGSIGSTTGATTAVRTATKAFLAALSGTGSQVSIIDFSTTAGRPIGYTVVTAETITGTFNPVYRQYQRQRLQPERLDELGGRLPRGGRGERTWHQGRSRRLHDRWRPNRDATPTSGTDDGTHRRRRRGAATRGARGQQRQAASGSHIFALGVGAAVNNARSANRLTAVSGFEQYPGNPFSKADFTLVEALRPSWRRRSARSSSNSAGPR